MPQTSHTPADPSAERLQSLSAVLPAFNEEDVILEVVTSTSRFLPKVAVRHELIVVDDGSTDRTAEILDELAEKDRNLVIVHHSGNRGYGAALRSGFARARHDYVFYMDGDGQFGIEDLNTLVPLVSQADIITGYRKNRQDPAHRRLHSKLFNAFTRFALGLRLRDIDCAFKIYRREALQSLDLLCDGILIDTEIFYKAKRSGFSVREVPVTHLPRTAGTATGNRPGVVLKVIRELPKLRRGRLVRAAPRQTP